MRKRILVIILLSIAMVCLFAFVGCKTPDEGPKGEQGIQGVPGDKGDKGEPGDSFWTSNPQGLAYYPQDDGTFAVGAGQSILLSEITVPETFIGKTVTTVIEDGFTNCKNLKKITLPASITVISDNAFKDCTKLNKVVLGETEHSKIFVLNDKYTSAIGNIKIGDYAFANTAFMQINIEDSSDNDTIVTCNISNKAADVTKVKVSAALNATTDIRFDSEIDLAASETKKSKNIDFGTYGRFNGINIDLYKGTQKVTSLTNGGGVAISADEYNFAPLNGSYPVLVFTLKLQEITKNGTIPTFVYMERVAQYNWDKLPAGVSCMTYETRSAATAVSDFHGLRAGMANYIKELYELNDKSKFNLYLVDNYGELVLQMLVANRIPTAQWTATLLSDGAGTAGILCNTFAVDNPSAKYDEMKANWATIKETVYEAGSFDYDSVSSQILYKRTGNIYHQMLENYAYIMAKEESNIEWWVNRLRTNENLVAINNKDSSFANAIVSDSSVKSYYTNNLLAALSEEQKQAFKLLYKFNDDMFAQAEEQNKKAVIILGTSWDGENGNIYGYIKSLIDFYGTDDYVYYYKGHPGYPTAQYVGRQEAFNRLAEDGYTMYELDNAIAAEIILYFNPGVYMAGYSTSTFDSAESQDKALVLFGSKASFAGATYEGLFDLFVSIVDSAKQSELTTAGITFEIGHDYFLLEYNNTAEYANQVANYNKHEIAILDATTKVTKYYKLSGSTYNEVDVDGNAV